MGEEATCGVFPSPRRAPPPPRPQVTAPPRFLCDVMAEGLARQLRLCGYDAESLAAMEKLPRHAIYRRARPSGAWRVRGAAHDAFARPPVVALAAACALNVNSGCSSRLPCCLPGQSRALRRNH
jgi:hypothetical protein